MQRGSDRLSVHRDDEMKHELQELLRSGHPTRTEDWQDPEPPADDDPRIFRGPVVAGHSRMSTLESVRLELARHLGRTAFPAGPGELAGVLRHDNAPDDLVEAVRRLPRHARYDNIQQLAETVTAAS
ncbi:DUF2795 domain-containing protein [Streptomyces sp. NPDC005209]|uniref:DUF2795 domain-containing protein n=1 Tax=Streptomyces sp. NPDC005209 TaxID=3156715 RepID=UPI0033A2EF20